MDLLQEGISENLLVNIALFAAMKTIAKTETSCKNPNEHRVMLHICKVPLITVLGGALSHWTQTYTTPIYQPTASFEWNMFYIVFAQLWEG